MALKKNEFGVVQYPADDARRLFVLAAAIDLLERATPASIADLTGIAIDAIDGDVDILREQYGMKITKLGSVYRIADWGEVLQREGVVHRMKDPGQTL
ncbi:MAG TPA: hypothetical protein VF472_20590 [Burkholderiaceae bacterium]